MSSTTRGQKRKNDIAPPAGDDEQLASGSKKAKTIQSANPSNTPAPQLEHTAPRRRVLKEQPVGQKLTSSSIPEAVLKNTEERAVTRKRPAENEVVDEGDIMAPASEPRFGPPSKKLKANVNKPRALGRTGSFFH